MRFLRYFNLLGTSFRGKVGFVVLTRQISMSEICKVTDSSRLSQNGPDIPLKVETVGPKKWKTLETQVGGHQFTHGEYEHQKLGIIDIGDSLILKSLQNPPRGTRELSFYQKAFDCNCDDADLLELRPFLPTFCGTEDKGGAKFLKLTNLTSGFKHPCVIDLKMGRITYDQEATPEKMAHEVEKYPPLKNLGFQIIGMMVYNPETHTSEQYGKPYCRVLTEENIVQDGLGQFFRLPNNDLRRETIQKLLSKLKKLEIWFLKQRKFSFIASSLLIVYEGSMQSTTKEAQNTDTPDHQSYDLKENKNKNNLASIKDNSSSSLNESANSKSLTETHESDVSSSGRPEKVKHIQETTTDSEMPQRLNLKRDSHRVECPEAKEVEVHLIDFAHVFPANDIDHNFLFGLQKLISSLQTLLE